MYKKRKDKLIILAKILYYKRCVIVNRKEKRKQLNRLVENIKREKYNCSRDSIVSLR